MSCLADESVDRQIVDSLRRCVHDVLYVAEIEPGISDDAVLDLVSLSLFQAPLYHGMDSY